MNWTPTDVVTLKQLIKDGNTDESLSIFFGVSEPAVRRARQRFVPDSVKRREKHPLEVQVEQAEKYLDGPFAPGAVWIGAEDGIIRDWDGSKWVPRGGEKLSQVNPAYKDASPTGDPLIEQAKTVPAEFGSIPLEVFDGDAWTKIGLVADTHLCCREERLDALHAQYDLFSREGVKDVFHAGNIVDGYVPRINGGSVYESSIDGQATYCANHYPRRSGITTHFITGNDHEGWWQKEGFNFGAYLQMVCERLGRQDMKYIGHVEADVVLSCGEHKQHMKIQHPGGGSAYARSYKGQKMVESFQGGEKPAILVQGHYHVSGYSFDRNVHIIGMPGFQEQTIFGRTKHLRYEIGGVILEFKMSSVTGAITRVRPEFNMFFDRGFYKKFLPSDSTLRVNPKTITTGGQQ